MFSIEIGDFPPRCRYVSLKDMMVEVVNCVSGLYELIINIGAELSDAVVFCTGKLQAMSNIVKKLKYSY